MTDESKATGAADSSETLSASDLEALVDVAENASHAVGGGRSTAEQITASAIEEASDLLTDIDARLRDDVVRGIVRRAIRRQVAAQADWPSQTDCDRLDTAFADLRSQGFATDEGTICCNSCAQSGLRDALSASQGLTAFAYYHAQDLWRVESGSPWRLMIGYGGKNHDYAEFEDAGRRVASTLAQHGLDCEWDGNPEERIAVNLVWQARWGGGLNDEPESPVVAGILDEIDRLRDMRGDRRVAESIFLEGLEAYDVGDIETARLAFEKAAAQSDTASMDALGVIAYDEGDSASASAWWERAAALGDASSMQKLSQLAEQQGDVATRCVWLERAAAHGDVFSINQLGLLARDSGDLASAKSWWEKAVDEGDDVAMVLIGTLEYESGDRESALTWFRTAAEQGNIEAAAFLGAIARETGDLDEASVWFEVAAKAGDIAAMKAVAELADERGDFEAAEAWRLEISTLEQQALAAIPEGLRDVTVGDVVDHEVFGRGVVTERAPIDNVVVAFESGEAKPLHLAYAPMVIVRT